ncbi:MAG: WD40 repeat domain-containing protein [Microcoleus vaginatus WJT46-NPBG5]|jgi:WD40 repeat protein|nr:WD40 repeat domain-containing protein [Microcoleus vaginatus WJT46-NPBG5]
MTVYAKFALNLSFMSWQNAQLIRTLSERSGPVADLAFSPDGLILASGSCDSTVKLWNLETGDRHRSLFGYPLGVNAVAINSDGTMLAIGAPDGTVDLWDMETGKRLRTLCGQGRVTAIVFSPDGKTLVSGNDNSFSDTVFATPANKGNADAGESHAGSINIWHLSTGKLLYNLCDPSVPVNALAISPDGKSLVSGHRDGTINIWHRSSRPLPSHTLNGHQDAVYSIAISSNGQILASGSGDKTIKLWQLANGQSSTTLIGHADAVYTVALSPDGQLLASGSGDGTITIWQMNTGKRLCSLTGYSQNLNSVMSVVFSPDGQKLATGSGDGTIKIWQAS